MTSIRFVSSSSLIALCCVACGGATAEQSSLQPSANAQSPEAPLAAEPVQVDVEATPATNWRLTRVSGAGSLWLPVADGSSERLTHEDDSAGFPFAVILDGRAVWLDLTQEQGRARLGSLDGPVTLKLGPGELGDDAVMEHLRAAPGALALDLSTQPIDEATAARIATLSGVERLDLTRGRIEDGALSALEGLPRLHTLELWMASPVDDAVVAVLAAFPALSDLGLSGTGITNAAATSLGSMSALQRVSLDETAISDEGLTSLSGLTQLRTLSLAQTQITDAGLVTLGSLAGLRQLWLPNTLSSEAVAGLQAALPDTEISLQ